MREVTLSREPHRLSGPLSAKIAQIRSMVVDARSGISLGVDQLEALAGELQDMTGEARMLEQADRHDPASVACIAYHLVAQVGDELLVLRSLLAEMMHTPEQSDAEEQVVCAFARARALLEKGEAVFLGKAKS